MSKNSPPLLLPDPTVARRYGISLMSLWRWTRDKKLSFPQPLKIRERNYRSAAELDAFDRRQIEIALASRGKRR
jgi:predicted DNA-binding transcriptional regulator AlpA